MINDILAFWTPAPLAFIIIAIIVGIPVLLIILLVRYGLRNKRENVRLRLEVGKLADELEQMRKQKKKGERGTSPSESG